MALVRHEATGEALGTRKCLTWLEIQGYDATTIIQLIFALQSIARILGFRLSLWHFVVVRQL